jgi:type I restriction enzyme M protein
MNNEEQDFLNGLEKKLWTAANKLLPALDAAHYKHVMLGLVFLKYTSDAFEIRREQLRAQFAQSDNEYFIDPADFDEGVESQEYLEEVNVELEVRDFYTEKNVFWVPKEARWSFLRDKNPPLLKGGELEVGVNSSTGKGGKIIRSVGQLIDHALEAIEKDNSKLKGVLNKLYTTLKIDQSKLAELIDLISTVPFNHATMNSKDILGHVYEYFLGQFALAEGKKGGQYYTPKSIVSLIVEMLQPYKGRVYDPAMGSGGFFVQSEKFITEHGGKIGAISIYGQEYNHTTWQLAAMNMAIRGIDFNFGKEPASTYTNNQHPDLRADYIMANPPFNMKEWDVGVSDDDPRWQYGQPPSNNANFAWMQHMLHHLAPNGSMGLLLANGSMSTKTSNEGIIRKALIENDLVECMIALPGQLFTNTQIPACIWFLTKNKGGDTNDNGRKLRNRKGEVLFIDARNLGYMKDRVLCDFKPEDIEQVTNAFHNWQVGEDYEDEAGFVKSVELGDIEKHDFELTPGRYVGAADVEDDGEAFGDKMARLTGQLKKQFEQSDTLEQQIKNNLKGLGYEV